MDYGRANFRFGWYVWFLNRGGAAAAPRPSPPRQEVLHDLELAYGTLFTQLTTGIPISSTDAVLVSDFIIQLKMRNPYCAKQVYPKKGYRMLYQTVNELLSKADSIPQSLKHIPLERGWRLERRLLTTTKITRILKRVCIFLV